MPNPITPEMRAALAAVIDQTECGLLAWHDIGESVENRLPILRALLDALPATTEDSSAVAGRVCMESNFPETDGPLRRQFLVGGTRFKLASSKNGAKFDGFPAELSGRWVALVAADNDEHLRARPAADHSEDARAMVTVEARRAMFEAWARGEGLGTTRMPEWSSAHGEYVDIRVQMAWRAVLAATASAVVG